ncbi:hypothetical protein VNI00_009455 [Paramarasmius palmivorus]|uniref:Uncharacterized protein n=1 Tax=Paramarasmius palmivorus TaxID=297713 RepID=A0AAW0CM44_9AGAR
MSAKHFDIEMSTFDRLIKDRRTITQPPGRVLTILDRPFIRRHMIQQMIVAPREVSDTSIRYQARVEGKSTSLETGNFQRP